jgi:hypothetical protein
MESKSWELSGEDLDPFASDPSRDEITFVDEDDKMFV